MHPLQGPNPSAPTGVGVLHTPDSLLGLDAARASPGAGQSPQSGWELVPRTGYTQTFPRGTSSREGTWFPPGGRPFVEDRGHGRTTFHRTVVRTEVEAPLALEGPAAPPPDAPRTRSPRQRLPGPTVVSGEADSIMAEDSVQMEDAQAEPGAAPSEVADGMSALRLTDAPPPA